MKNRRKRRKTQKARRKSLKSRVWRKIHLPDNLLLDNKSDSKENNRISPHLTYHRCSTLWTRMNLRISKRNSNDWFIYLNSNVTVIRTTKTSLPNWLLQSWWGYQVAWAQIKGFVLLLGTYLKIKRNYEWLYNRYYTLVNQPPP